MKKIILVMISLIALVASLHAEKERHETQLATHTGVYFEPKAIFLVGETIKDGEASLEGNSGLGFGFDLGYSFTEYFALELDGTFAKNDVTETDSLGDTRKSRASYYTYGTNAVLTYPVSTHFIILGKVGYGYEHEEIRDLGIKGSEKAANWAVGVEYSFTPHLEISLEYEAADIRSTRGNTVQLGLIYKL